MTKTKRFEIFKRDGFQCAYCGQKPPAVILEVDHIEPKSKGGPDDESNLITACFDCNRGKSDKLLNSIPSPLSENIELIKEREEQVKEYRKVIRIVAQRIEKDIEHITNIYKDQYTGMTLSDHFKNGSLKKFLEQLSIDEVERAMQLSIAKIPADDHKVIKYFCGICWNEIKGKNPQQKLKNEWIKLCKYHNKSSWYCKDSDLFKLSEIPFDKIIYMIHKTLEDHSYYCWDRFIELCEQEGYI